MSKISQREARRLRTRVEQLEEQLEMQRRSWSSDWPGGIHIATGHGDQILVAKIKVARQRGHAVVVTDNGEAKFELRALPLPVKP